MFNRKKNEEFEGNQLKANMLFLEYCDLEYMCKKILDLEESSEGRMHVIDDLIIDVCEIKRVTYGKLDALLDYLGLECVTKEVDNPYIIREKSKE